MIYSSSEQRNALLQKQGFCIHVADSKNVAFHGHDFLEFTYIQKGSIEHSFGGCTKTLCEGDYFIVDYGTKHWYKSTGGDVSVINILFYPWFIDRTLGRYDNFEKVVNSYLIRFKYRALDMSPAGVAFEDSDKKVLGLLQAIAEESEKGDAGHLEYIRCLVVQMLIITMRKISSQDKRTGESPVISQIVKHIKENYRQKLCLSDYAKQYNYSLSHISKKFSQEMGEGFNSYLQRMRIEQSCRLLSSENMSISEVATAVGYGNIKFFNKLFKQTLGVTPGKFKKMNEGM